MSISESIYVCQRRNGYGEMSSAQPVMANGVMCGSQSVINRNEINNNHQWQ